MEHSEINAYLDIVKKKLTIGAATEHTFRPALLQLIETLSSDIESVNEPKHPECGAPDFIVYAKDNNAPICYGETKNIYHNLDKRSESEEDQLNRYLKGLSRVIFTNYLDFIFFQNEKEVARVKIADVDNNKIIPNKNAFADLEKYIRNFCSPQNIEIKSAFSLAEIMAQKAVLLREIVKKALDAENMAQKAVPPPKAVEKVSNKDLLPPKISTLARHMTAFKDSLISDLSNKSFADVYAQTVTYGLFVARMNDTTLENFDLYEACRLISRTNPFLYRLFNEIAIENDSRISWLIEDLVNIFRYLNIPKLLASDPKLKDDPFLYFYEHFLNKYDKETKFKRGVFYTPKPIVKFIVNAVDAILKKDFHLADGLANTDRINTQDKEEFKVQILDPAIGTGTFLVEVIRKIHEQLVSQAGTWQNYVENLLIPRLNGFEIMMTPYILCHIKLEKQLVETGYQPRDNQRIRVYLTNSLESSNKQLSSPPLTWLEDEVTDANFVKENTAIMVCLGNPPWGLSGYNKSDYINKLTQIYKDGIEENHLQALSDDYVKFIRLGENFIEKNQEGILAYVTNNSFLDGKTHRCMREHLLHTFDKIFVVNLHGDGHKKEKSPDGSKDENLFNIMQGVCITVFVKTKRSENELAKVYYMDLFGSRVEKSDYLSTQMWNEDNFTEINPIQPMYFFAPKDLSLQSEYDEGFGIHNVFLQHLSGIETQKDSITIQFTKNGIQQVIRDFQNYNENELSEKYHLSKSLDWNYVDAKNDIMSHSILTNKVLYRLFDTRFTAYTGKKGFMARSRYEVMKHFLFGENTGLCTCKLLSSAEWMHIFVTTNIIDRCYVSNKGKETTYLFPLYLYEDTLGTLTRRPNLNADIVEKFAACINMQFTEEKTSDENTFAPIDILDYIYGILHSRKYRTKYNEFLRIDFPKIPYPQDREYFLSIANLGGQLRNLHLLKDMSLTDLITSFPIAGDNIVSKVCFENNRVYINPDQYFDGVSEVVWNFPIGGYIPAQKWLKDRKNRTLTADDIFHYQKIIAALSETIALMDKIDKVV